MDTEIKLLVVQSPSTMVKIITINCCGRFFYTDTETVCNAISFLFICCGNEFCIDASRMKQNLKIGIVCEQNLFGT